ncbi:MAG: 50S ribosomal protein L23 [Nanoarchaeota archaeon]
MTADPKAAADAWNILKYPYLTEKSTRMIESQNKLVFIVKDRSSKAQIKEAVEAVFGVKVADVNTTSTMRGEKKAYIRLKPEFKAVDIATKLGMM